jgi:ABC-type glycerol-3-phosphate transport system permease component
LNDPSIASKIRYYLTCCQGRNKFRLHRGQEEIKVKIERAPEPEDILWSNLAVPTGEYAKRKIITYTVTFAMLGASFGIVYGLSKAQQSNTDNQALSLAISACISVVNIIISIVIQKLSAFEMEYTQTKYQTSLALKSIFAALINSILIPMMVNYYIKEDIYGKNGLASDVFMLGLTNSFVSPILKIVNISYIVNRISKHFASSPSNNYLI